MDSSILDNSVYKNSSSLQIDNALNRLESFQIEIKDKKGKGAAEAPGPRMEPILSVLRTTTPRTSGNDYQ
jgi:hypothetical protein